MKTIQHENHGGDRKEELRQAKAGGKELWPFSQQEPRYRIFIPIHSKKGSLKTLQRASPGSPVFAIPNHNGAVREAAAPFLRVSSCVCFADAFFER